MNSSNILSKSGLLKKVIPWLALLLAAVLIYTIGLLWPKIDNLPASSGILGVLMQIADAQRTYYLHYWNSQSKHHYMHLNEIIEKTRADPGCILYEWRNKKGDTILWQNYVIKFYLKDDASAWCAFAWPIKVSTNIDCRSYFIDYRDQIYVTEDILFKGLGTYPKPKDAYREKPFISGIDTSRWKPLLK